MAVILQVAVPSPLRKTFDYLPADSTEISRLQVGTRLEIPFGKQKKTVGLLINITDKSTLAVNKLKKIHRIIDNEPLLDKHAIKLLRWACRYYQHPIGDACFSTLPKFIKQGRELLNYDEQQYTVDITDINILNRAPKQAALVKRLQTETTPVSIDQIKQWPEYSRQAFKNLIDKKIVLASTQKTADLPKTVELKKQLAEPTDEQSKAIKFLTQNNQQYVCTLLNGITGSGKTHVYMHAMEQALQKNLQVLLLLPEIGLTPQLVQHFTDTFACEIGLYHSGLTDLQRYTTWCRARDHKLKIIIGTRSAVWLPFENLGLIIIDEEHDQSYKQQEGFRYSARDVAVFRAQQENIPIVLGSATPSMESCLNVQRDRYQEVQLQNRVGHASLPSIEVIDLKTSGKKGALSEPLLQEIKQTLAKQQQVLLFINQRGFAPVMLCDACGNVAYCDRCDKPMTYHQQRQIIWCHHCDRQIPLTTPCQDCQQQQWIEIGHGTERVEQEIAEFFPQATIQRVDRDTTRLKGSLDNYLQQIRRGEVDILIGTQMLTKGHDFHRLTLVGILDIDNGLFSTDFRASERLAQLITQVSGRAGRAEAAGKVLLQTHQPDHPLLNTLIQHGYNAFAKQLLLDRKSSGLPPFSYQALLRAEAVDSQNVRNFLNAARVFFPTSASTRIFGPITAPMAKRAGKQRMQLLLESNERKGLSETLINWISKIETLPTATKVRWNIDVDPLDMT